MRRWLKRTLIVAGIAALALLVFFLAALALYKAAPDWYPAHGSPERIGEAAQSAETKLAETTNWAAMLNGDAVRAARAQESGRPAPATRVTDDFQIRFTEDELNALFAKWSALYGWGARYDQWMENPRIILRKNRLILAAQVKEFGTVASFHFAPHLDEQSALHLDLKRVMGGRLPLPDMLWDRQKQQVISGLNRSIPEWQTTAALDRQGAANEPAALVILGRLVLRAANHEPAAPIILMPLLESSKTIPVKVAALSIDDDGLVLQVRRLTPDEIAALSQTLHAPAR